MGVDIVHRPRYPFPFVLDDAILYVLEHGHEYDLIHASPPCQGDCALTVGTNRSKDWGGGDLHVSLAVATRAALDEVGVPYVIEQPDGVSGIRKDVTLCGEMFGLGVLRHRNFELGGWTADFNYRRDHKKHRGYVRGYRHGVYRDGPYVAAYGKGGGKATVPEMQEAMGITWTDVHEELTEAIPPAYGQYLGEQFMAWASA